MRAKANPAMEAPCVSVYTVLVLLEAQDTDRFQGDGVVERGHGSWSASAEAVAGGAVRPRTTTARASGRAVAGGRVMSRVTIRNTTCGPSSGTSPALAAVASSRCADTVQVNSRGAAGCRRSRRSTSPLKPVRPGQASRPSWDTEPLISSPAVKDPAARRQWPLPNWSDSAGRAAPSSTPVSPFAARITPRTAHNPPAAVVMSEPRTAGRIDVRSPTATSGALGFRVCA